MVSLSSENGAHRIAVEWNEGEETREGVFIPRRDTSSKINSFVGGKIFPGRHFHADFKVKESGDHYEVAFKSSDGTTIEICADKTSNYDSNSIFEDIETASDFFKGGALGYSPSGNQFEGLELRTKNWKVEPLNVSQNSFQFF